MCFDFTLVLSCQFSRGKRSARTMEARVVVVQLGAHGPHAFQGDAPLKHGPAHAKSLVSSWRRWLYSAVG